MVFGAAVGAQKMLGALRSKKRGFKGQTRQEEFPGFSQIWPKCPIQLSPPSFSEVGGEKGGTVEVISPDHDIIRLRDLPFNT